MNNRKGIILAGGKGTRFFPVTKSLSKHFLPIYDKPMIYYSLSTLMLANIKEILLISTPRDLKLFKELLGDGSSFGIKIEYLSQLHPDGIAQALILAEDFLDGSPSALILGDNFFYGEGLQKRLRQVSLKQSGATIILCRVKDPQRYGIAEFDSNENVISLNEKPSKPKSDFAITGIYFFDQHAPTFAKGLLPSKRGEIEITDLNKIYLKNNNLFIEKLGRGSTWLDAGTPDSLLEASHFVQTIEHRQGFKICCPEEIAFKNGWVSKEKILNNLKSYQNLNYSKYIFEILK